MYSSIQIFVWLFDLNGAPAATYIGAEVWDKLSQSQLICIGVHFVLRAYCVLNIEIHMR